MKFSLLDSGRKSAAANMALDSRLLSDLNDGDAPILHLYEWERSSATYGYFVDPDRYFSMEGVKKRELDLARRPTGGGIIFHNCDLAFSVLVPRSDPAFSENTLANYAFINGLVAKAIGLCLKLEPSLFIEKEKPLNDLERFCMAQPTKYDLVINGKKVVGAAQRKTLKGYLHQGSIFLSFVEENFFRETLKSPEPLLGEMKKNSYPLIKDPCDLEEARVTLSQSLKNVFLEI